MPPYDKEKIKEYFPESEFKIIYDSEEDEYKILSNNEKNDLCLVFKIDGDHIIIEQINKCKSFFSLLDKILYSSSFES